MAKAKEKIIEFWDENKRAIKFGIVTGLIGMVYGTIKGITVEAQAMGNTMNRLIEKIPELPAPDDLPIEEILGNLSPEEKLDLMTKWAESGTVI